MADLGYTSVATGKSILDVDQLLGVKKGSTSDDEGILVEANSIASKAELDTKVSKLSKEDASKVGADKLVVTDKDGNFVPSDKTILEVNNLNIKNGTGELSIVENDTQNNTSSGKYSHVEGSNNTSTAEYNHVEGIRNTVSKTFLYTIGTSRSRDLIEGDTSEVVPDNELDINPWDDTSLAKASHTEGYKNTNCGTVSHVEGSENFLSGFSAHVEGRQNTVSGTAAHAEGSANIASGNSSHVEGSNSKASGVNSHSEGYKTESSGQYSHAEGENSVASARTSHAEGQYTVASQAFSHAEGRSTMALGNSSHAEGDSPIALGHAAHAEGCSIFKTCAAKAISEDDTEIQIYDQPGNSELFRHCIFRGDINDQAYNPNTLYAEVTSVTEQRQTSSDGAVLNASLYTIKLKNKCPFGVSKYYTIQEFLDGKYGWEITASSLSAEGEFSHCEGSINYVSGVASHAEGNRNIISGNTAHAEGDHNIVSGPSAHAEGQQNKVTSSFAHAEGSSNEASGNSSHSEGILTVSSGKASHAEGYQNKALGQFSHVSGSFNVCNNDSETALGKYNNSTSSSDESQATLFTIGNGKNENNRSNAIEIKKNGDIYILLDNNRVKLQDLLKRIS